MKTVIYSGTFNPITNGHIDLVERAACLFDKVIIAVAESPGKSPLFSLEDRISLCEQSLTHVDGVEVCGFTGLMVDVARNRKACAVLRGVRGMVDYEYELQLHNMNRDMYPEFETVFLSPAKQLAHISSTLVREITSLGGDVSRFVSPQVLKALQGKFPG